MERSQKIVATLFGLIALSMSVAAMSACAMMEEGEDGTLDEIDPTTYGAKVTICHNTGSRSNPTEIIDVSLSAVSAHLAHGDSIGDTCDEAPPPPPVCTPGEAVSCYSGPAGTEGVGTCTAGSQVCNDSGTGYGACTGEVLPAVELCDDLDRDCDGVNCG